MAENPRIEELRRRVEADPASIAFAALAEEYRRSGAWREAINTCRIGLQRHPSYLSAHVTLGRALIEIGEYDEARQELDLVLKSAPENLAALRAMADLNERSGQPAQAAPPSEPPRPIPVATSPSAPSLTDWNLPPAEETAAQYAAPPAPASAAQPAQPAADATTLGRLETFLAAIQAARETDRRSR